MKVIDIAEVESLEVRPHVTINPRSYYMEPRVIGRDGGSGGVSSEEVEAIRREVTAIRNYAQSTAADLETLGSTVDELSDMIGSGDESLESLSDRVTTMENSTRTLNTLVQAANNNATQALNAVSTINNLVPATAAEVNVVCN